MIYCKVFNTQQELTSWYDVKYREMGGTWHTPPEDCNRHLDDLLQDRQQRGHLLDVGCGGGRFIEQARKRGFRLILGIDPSTEAIAFARRRLNVPTAAFGTSINLITNELKTDELERYHAYSTIHGYSTNSIKYDYIVSLGSLEHVVNLGICLDIIRQILKDNGRWYFYLPNEKWTHTDQPNERTASSEEWKVLLAWHGLIADGEREWTDNTAIWGHKI